MKGVLGLDGLSALPDLLGDVLDLDDRVRLSDVQGVLSEECAIQSGIGANS